MTTTANTNTTTISLQLTAEQARLVLTAIEQEINAGEDTFLSNHNVADLRDAADEIAAAITMSEEGEGE